MDRSYLAEKGVASYGLRQDALGRLLVPVRDAERKLWSFQRISADGSNQFYEGGRVEGGHYVVGDTAQPGSLLIAEGYATAATLHALTGRPAIVAFNAGNPMPVARTYRQLFPEREIYIAGDNDHRREAEGKPNVGREKAEEAAAAIGSFALLPTFSADDFGSDWNDLARAQGTDTARQQPAVTMAVANASRRFGRWRWTAGMIGVAISRRRPPRIAATLYYRGRLTDLLRYGDGPAAPRRLDQAGREKMQALIR